MKMKLLQMHAVTPSQACAAFDTALEWLESKGNTHPAHLMLVKSWRTMQLSVA